VPRKVVRAATKHRRAKKAGIAALGGYNAQLEAQLGACAICGRRPKEGGRRLNIEHDHLTMRCRGLTCHFCNRMLAWARDDPNTLMTGNVYLKHGWEAACVYRDAIKSIRG